MQLRSLSLALLVLTASPAIQAVTISSLNYTAHYQQMHDNPFAYSQQERDQMLSALHNQGEEDKKKALEATISNQQSSRFTKWGASAASAAAAGTGVYKSEAARSFISSLISPSTYWQMLPSSEATYNFFTDGRTCSALGTVATLGAGYGLYRFYESGKLSQCASAIGNHLANNKKKYIAGAAATSYGLAAYFDYTRDLFNGYTGINKIVNFFSNLTAKKSEASEQHAQQQAADNNAGNGEEKQTAENAGEKQSVEETQQAADNNVGNDDNAGTGEEQQTADNAGQEQVEDAAEAPEKAPEGEASDHNTVQQDNTAQQTAEPRDNAATQHVANEAPAQHQHTNNNKAASNAAKQAAKVAKQTSKKSKAANANTK